MIMFVYPRPHARTPARLHAHMPARLKHSTLKPKFVHAKFLRLFILSHVLRQKRTFIIFKRMYNDITFHLMKFIISK